MSNDLFLDCIRAIRRDTDQYDTLTFAGFGEPLMDKGFLDKVEIAQGQGFKHINLLTNGSLLTREKFLRMQELGMETVRISFYGMTSESYGKVHGCHGRLEEYARLRRTIDEICALSRTTRLIMTFNVVLGANEDDLQAWISHWEGRADLVEAWRPHNWVYGRNMRTVTGALRKSCGRPFTGPLQVQVDGTVNMCCFDFNGDLTLGDLKRQRLADIFSSEPFLRLRACHQSGDYSGSDLICAGCDQRKSDKTEVMVYNSQFDINTRVEMTSTTYKFLSQDDETSS